MFFFLSNSLDSLNLVNVILYDVLKQILYNQTYVQCGRHKFFSIHLLCQFVACICIFVYISPKLFNFRHDCFCFNIIKYSILFFLFQLISRRRL